MSFWAHCLIMSCPMVKGCGRNLPSFPSCSGHSAPLLVPHLLNLSAWECPQLSSGALLSACADSLADVIPSGGFKLKLYVTDSRMCISSPDLSLELQTFISNSLFDFPWSSKGHLIHISKATSSSSPSKPASFVVFLLQEIAMPWFLLLRHTLQSSLTPIFSFISSVRSVSKSSQFDLQNVSRMWIFLTAPTTTILVQPTLLSHLEGPVASYLASLIPLSLLQYNLKALARVILFKC